MLQPRIKPVPCAGVLLLLPLLVSPVVARADESLVGVPGWTSGSQTFIRARPSALTPPVAKVPTRTPVYVWGRYEDWYRVETKDHIFGWVHKNYIDARRLRKVKTISHFKAKEASDKSSSQTMFGTPEQLKAYHARYGGSGAVKGLALKGIYVGKPKTAPVRLAKRLTIPVRVAQVPHIVAQKPRLPVQKPSVKTRVRVASRPAPTVMVNPIETPVETPAVQATVPSGGTLLQPPTAQELGTDHNAGEALRTAPDAMAPDASSLAAKVRDWTPATAAPTVSTPSVTRPRALSQKPAMRPKKAPSMPAYVAPPVAVAPAIAIAPPVATVPAGVPRVAIAPRPNQGEVALAPVAPGSNVLMAPAPVVTQVAPRGPSPEQLHIKAWQERKRAKEQKWKWLQVQKAKQWKWRQAQAQKRAIAAQNRRKLLAKQRENHRIYLASRKGKQREVLGARVGLAPKQLPPNVPGGSLAPISPDEILQRRDEYLKNNASQPLPRTAPSPANPGTPFTPSGLSSPAPLRNLTKKLALLLFGSRQQKSQTAQELSASSATSSGESGHAASFLDAGTTTTSMPVPFPVPSAPIHTSSVAHSRGGSPRDRAAMAWRSGVATQALSYRGMPYVFGSASPSRGFDCSGLIYFLLRQRGLNPPRTAAGYRTYGHAVGRGQWQAGDLILFANTYKHGISHIGVYLKDGKFVHAASTGQGVRVDSLFKGYFASKYYGARRVN